jgi:DNA-binding MarR family transcriptional regulator
MPTRMNHLDSDKNHDLWTLFDSAHFAVSRLRLLEIAQYGLTKEQAQILYIIQSHGGAVTMSQISDFSMRQHHSIYTLINRMIKVGLLKKTKTPKDRVFKIVMTSKAQNKYDKLRRDSIEMIFSSLKTEDRSKFAECLIELQKTARNMLGLDNKPPFLKPHSQIESGVNASD